MSKHIAAIAYFTLQEGLRNRLFSMTVVGLVCLFGLTEFAGDLAITESRQVQAALAGGVLRLYIAVTIVLFVLTSMTREINDKALELILAMPFGRSGYYYGKLLGYLGLALIMIFLSGLLLLLYAQPGPVLSWSFSLACEVMLLLALSMLCLFTFSNVTVSFIVVMAFYVLSRSITAIQLISSSPILDVHTFAHEFMQWLIHAIATLLPDLSYFTDSTWLVYGLESGTLVNVGIQTLIYLALLVAAGLFDLYRKEI
jgi:ABC-type transport system involved in multi-copper enzyme maturation permease subunit